MTMFRTTSQGSGGRGYSSYQLDIYTAGREGRLPALPVAMAELEASARRAMSPEADGYVSGSAGTEATARANLAAFDQRRLLPRMLRDVRDRDLRVHLLGNALPTPLLLAPVGVQSIVHPEAEVAAARGAADVAVPFVLSTCSSEPMEEVARCSQGPRWFQLYWPTEDDLTDSLVTRAADAGYDVLVVTLDTRMLAWRPRDLRHGFLPFLRAEGLANYLTDPVFLAGLPDDGRAIKASGWRSLDDTTTDHVVARWLEVFADLGQTWSSLASLVARSPLPVVVKGIQHPTDARAAVEAGAAGLIVSNHGGRQVDGAAAALDALAPVRRAVGDAVAVLFDSGVRSGADIAIALALGADSVLIGRPYLWGLALAGADGVTHVLRCLLAELDLTLAMIGVDAVADLTQEILQPDRP